MTSYIRSFTELTAHERATVGDTKTSVITDDHMGWLLCDGRSLKTKDYYFLFQIIRYSFGGSGGNFNLPLPGGTVPGIVGTGTDSNNRQFTFNLGQQFGEYMHKLTIPEIPSHNHGVAGTTVTDQISSNNSTSVSYTRISTVVSTTGVTNNSHNHGYSQGVSGGSSGYVAAGENDGILSNSNIGNFSTNSVTVSINDPGHMHNITDPGHAHVLHSAGGDQFHNNIQPTLPIGNMFIYCGKVNQGTFPNMKSPYTYY